MSSTPAGPAAWTTCPRIGVRLQIADVVARLGISIRDLSIAVGVSKTATYNAISNSRWPRRMQRNVLEARLREVLAKHGASEEEVATLFCAAHTHKPAERARQVKLSHHQAEEGGADMLLPKATLTPRAAKHFKLFRNPFDGEVLSDGQFFLGTNIAYAKEAIWQCAQTSSFVALCGESGSGKTTVLAELEERLQAEQKGLIIIKPSVVGMEENDTKGRMLKSSDILHATIDALAPNLPVPPTLAARTLSAKKLLTASATMGNHHLLVVEEAHCMPDATLKHLKRMHEVRLGRRSLLGILLLAQPELKRRLSTGLHDGSLREVAQRCEIVQLLPLDEELKDYLECRAKAVGADLDRLIDDSGIDQLRARLTKRIDAKTSISLTYPLAVHNLITRAMNLAAELGVPLVNRDVVASA